MYRFRTALLAAAAIGAGIPAIASAQQGEQDHNDRPRNERADRGQRPDQGQPRQGERSQAQPQAQPVPAPPPQPVQAPPQQRPAPQVAQGRPDGRAMDRENRGERPQGFGQPGQPGQPDQRGFAGRDDRRPGYDPRQGNEQRQGDERRQGNEQRQAYGQRPGYDQRQGDPRQGYAGNGYRGGDNRGGDYRGAGGPQGRIGADWRNDRRYDWRGYRDQHRQTYHVGRYVPPRAYYRYGYRPYEIGVRLDPFFYASNYWIDDPYDYRLPPVWGSYRWVRYYDDVLLVDLATGEVVDVIHQFFW